MRFWRRIAKRGVFDLEDFFFYLLFFLFIIFTVIILGLESCSGNNGNVNFPEEKIAELSAKQTGVVYLNTEVPADILAEQDDEEKQLYEGRSFVFFADWLIKDLPEKRRLGAREGNHVRAASSILKRFIEAMTIFQRELLVVNQEGALTQRMLCLKISDGRLIATSISGFFCNTENITVPLSDGGRGTLGVGVS